MVDAQNLYRGVMDTYPLPLLNFVPLVNFDHKKNPRNKR